MIDINQFGKSPVIPDKFDIRDHRLDTIKFGAFVLPGEYSVKGVSDKTPVKNQGQSLSCGGQAVAKYAEMLTFLRDNANEELSAKDIYSNVFLPGGGSSARDLIKRVMNEGIAFEKDIPSQPTTEQYFETVQVRTAEQDAWAMQHWIKDYATYDSTDVEQVKTAIFMGKGCFIAVVGNNPCWTTQDGIIQVPAIGTTNWGHFFVLTGWKYINSKLYFEFVNSWSTDWGALGYGYLPAEYLVKGFGYSEWTLVEAPAQQYSVMTKLILALKNLIDLIKQQKVPNK